MRDGNHRVSVARAQGVECIDAEVTSLQSEIKLHVGMTRRQIFKRVLNYEKRVFYAETAFGDITDCWDLDFSAVGEYDVIYNHIQIHKYYINQDKTEEISMSEAILSWYNTVYLPVVNVLKKQHIMRKFRKRTISDMYVYLIKYWDELKHKFGDEISLDAAAEEFTNIYGNGFFKRLLKRIGFKLDVKNCR